MDAALVQLKLEEQLSNNNKLYWRGYLYYDNIPITSLRGTQFTSKYWEKASDSRPTCIALYKTDSKDLVGYLTFKTISGDRMILTSKGQPIKFKGLEIPLCCSVIENYSGARNFTLTADQYYVKKYPLKYILKTKEENNGSE